MSYVPPSLSYVNKPWKPHVLNKDEEKNIPEHEKTALMSMPGEKDCIWYPQQRKDGSGQYWWTIPVTFADKAPTLDKMLNNIETTDISHLVIGGFRFGKAKDKIMRAEHKQSGYENKQQGQRSYSAPPKFVKGVFFGVQDEVNDFLNEEQNKNKWVLYGEWKFNPSDGKPMAMISKIAD